MNCVRLVLAALVIVSHSAPIGGFGDDPHLGHLSLGRFSVAGFFALSGFLITGSRINSSLFSYGLRRAARILPGFWVCLAITAFLLAPLVGFLRGGWQAGGAVAYVAGNAPMLKWVGAIGQTLSGLPYPTTWNGSLWTLAYEILCYVIVGLVFTSAVARRARRTVIAAGFLLLTAFAVVTPQTAPHLIEQFSFITPYFAAGALLYAFQDVVPLRAWLAALSAVLLAGLVWTDVTLAFTALPMAYLMMWLSIVLPDRLKRVGARNDISYGIYLYGFPVQQTLVACGLAHLGYPAYAILAILCTVPLGWASWWAIERPLMSVARRVGRRPGAGTPVHTTASPAVRTDSSPYPAPSGIA